MGGITSKAYRKMVAMLAAITADRVNRMQDNSRPNRYSYLFGRSIVL